MRPKLRMVGALCWPLFTLAALAPGAHAQDLTFGGSLSTTPLGDPYLFRWQSAVQRVDVPAFASLYCEELEYGLFDVRVTLSDGASGAFATGTTATFSTLEVGCDYLSSPSSRAPDVAVQVPVVLDATTLSLLSRVAKNDRLTIEAVIDPTTENQPNGQLFEGGDPYFEVTNNVTAIEVGRASTFGVLSGRVDFGAVQTHVTWGTGALLPSLDCDPGDYRLYGDFELPESAGGGVVEDTDFEVLCARPTLDLFSGEYHLTVTGASGGRNRVAMTSLGGLTTKVVYRLTSGGLEPRRVYVQLPPGHTHHAQSTYDYEDGQQTRWAPSPRGSRWVTFSTIQSFVVGALDEVHASNDTTLNVVSQALPFAVRFTTLETSRRGLVGIASQTKWLRELPVHPLDPRHPDNDGPLTNDQVSSKVGASVGQVTIDSAGLSGDFVLNGGTATTVLPRASVAWTDGTLKVRDGALAAQLTEIAYVTLDNDTTCPGCSSTGGTRRPILLGRSGPYAGLAPDGALVARVRHEAPFVGDPDTTDDDLPSQEVGFGPAVTLGGTPRPTFLRGGTPGTGDIGRTGHLVIPGHLLPANTGPAAALLGTWRTVAGEQDGLSFVSAHDARPLEDVETRRGNGFFAGYTIGPEVLSDAQYQPVLDGQQLGGTKLSVAFPTAAPGSSPAHTAVDITVNDATKLVVRGTLTGVVNVDANATPQPQIYGYSFAFDRFAFGLVDSELSATTWIDGRVTVAGHGDFSVPFKSLGLTCTGQLGSGRVDFASLTPQRLRAWKTPWDISAIGFAPTGSDTSCSLNPRQLEVGGQVDIAAFARKVDLSARWSPLGQPGSIKVASLTTRLEKSASEPGFETQTLADDMRLGFDPANIELGWFDFGARLFVPFWKSFEVRLRLMNQGTLDDLTALPSLVVPKSFPPADNTASGLVEEWADKWRTKSNAELTPMFGLTAHDKSGAEKANNQALIDAIKLGAHVDWVIDLEGDVKWRPRTLDLSGRFIAASDSEKDLKVIKVKAAVPFITSLNTQYSFGFDADLRKLQDLKLPSLKVDLKNPETIKKIDDFLTGTPLNLPRLGDGKGPVEGGLGKLRSVVTDLASSVKSQFAPTLKKYMRDGIVFAFENLGVGDLIDLATKAVTSLQMVATQATQAVFAPLGGLVDQIVQALVAGPDQKLVELYQTLPPLLVAARDLASQEGEQARGLLKTGAAVTLSEASKAVAKAKGFVSEIDKKTTQAKTAINDLKKNLEGKVRDARCFLGYAPPPPNSPAGTVDLQTTQCGGRKGIRQYLEVAQLDFLKCDATKNPGLIEVTKLKTRLFAVLDTLANAGNSGLDKLVTGLGQKLPKIQGQEFKTDGLVKTFLDLTETAKWAKAKIDHAYKRIVGFGPNATAEEKKIKTFCGTLEGSALPKLTALAKDLQGYIDTINDGLGQVEGTLVVTLADLTKKDGLVDTFQSKVKDLVKVLDALSAQLAALDKTVQAAITNAPGVPPLSESDIRKLLDDGARVLTKLLGKEVPWVVPPAEPGGQTHSFLKVVADELAAPVYDLIGAVEGAVNDELSDLFAKLPLPKRDDLLKYMTNLVVESDFVKTLIGLVTDNLSFLEDKANEMVNSVLDQVTLFLQHAIDAVIGQASAFLQDALKDAKAALAEFPIQGAAVKGLAQINGQELEMLQISAKFTTNKTKGDTPNSQKTDTSAKEAKSDSAFSGELKVVSWAANNKAKACGDQGDPTEHKNTYDATITANNIPFVLGGDPKDPKSGLKISKLLLGFSVKGGTPIGLFGGINTTGDLKVAEFKLRNINFAFGAGTEEAYLGARAQAIFQSFNCEVAFFAGKACNLDPIKFVDPEVAKYIPPPPEGSPFTGAYVRGGVQIPVTDVGCMLRFGFGVEAALWFFVGQTELNGRLPVTIGGLVGGSVYGKALCLAAIRGGIRIAASYESATDQFSGTGLFYAGGGIGFSCDEDTWTSVQAIRNDDGCATVDISAEATLRDGDMNVGPVNTSGVD